MQIPLPKQALEQGKRTYRKMEMDGKEIGNFLMALQNFTQKVTKKS